MFVWDDFHDRHVISDLVLLALLGLAGAFLGELARELALPAAVLLTGQGLALPGVRPGGGNPGR